MENLSNVGIFGGLLESHSIWEADRGGLHQKSGWEHNGYNRHDHIAVSDITEKNVASEEGARYLL